MVASLDCVGLLFVASFLGEWRNSVQLYRLETVKERLVIEGVTGGCCKTKHMYVGSHQRRVCVRVCMCTYVCCILGQLAS